MLKFLMWLFVRWKYHTTFYSLRHILDIFPPFNPFFRYFSKTCSPFCGCHHEENLNKAVRVLEFCPITCDKECDDETSLKSEKDEFDQKLNSLDCCLPAGQDVFLHSQPEAFVSTTTSSGMKTKMFETAGKMYDSFNSFVTGLRDVVWDTGAMLPVTNNIDDFCVTLKKFKQPKVLNGLAK